MRTTVGLRIMIVAYYPPFICSFSTMRSFHRHHRRLRYFIVPIAFQAKENAAAASGAIANDGAGPSQYGAGGPHY